jgi:16S rRNA (guanine527-N7)-methyltransferase
MEILATGAERLGFHLTAKQLERFETYYNKLGKWNQKVNLTAITSYEDMQIKHFLDSLTVTLAFKYLKTNPPEKVIDIGTGAGMPGIPLKIILPSIHLTLVESIGKKTAFLEYITDQLDLDDVEIITARAEDIGHNERYREKFDLTLGRAVASLPTLLELTLPFCKVGGIFVAQKQTKAKPEIDRATRAIRTFGSQLREVIDIDLPEFADERCLIVFSKITGTPEEYPRRPGIPAKNPIVYT